MNPDVQLMERSAASGTMAPGLRGAFSPRCNRYRMGALGSRLQTEGLLRVSAHAGSLYSVSSTFQEHLGGSASDVSHFQLKVWGPFTCFSLAQEARLDPFVWLL